VLLWYVAVHSRSVVEINPTLAGTGPSHWMMKLSSSGRQSAFVWGQDQCLLEVVTGKIIALG